MIRLRSQGLPLLIVGTLCVSAVLAGEEKKVPLSPPAEPRTSQPVASSIGALRAWTDNTGHYHIKAALIEFKDGAVVLKREDGTTKTVAVEKLSETDQEYVRQLRNGQHAKPIADEEKPRAGKNDEPTAKAPQFPTANDAALAVLLEWMGTAEAEERDAFLEKASSVERLNAEASSALAFLRQLAHEGGGKTKEVIQGSTDLSTASNTTPTWAASAAFRSAELLEQEGKTRESVRMLAAARRLNRHGELWRRVEEGWRRDSVENVTQGALHRLRADRLTYRAMTCLADTIPLAGAYRFLAFLTVLVLAIRVLELPLLLRALNEYEKQCRGLPSTQRYLYLWLFVDVISINWAEREKALWQLLFDLGETSFLWMSSLAVRDGWLAVIVALSFCGFCCAFCWNGWRRMSLQARKGWLAYFAVIALVVAVSGYFSEEATAAGALYTIVLYLSGIAIFVGHAVMIRWHRRAWLKA